MLARSVARLMFNPDGPRQFSRAAPQFRRHLNRSQRLWEGRAAECAEIGAQLCVNTFQNHILPAMHPWSASPPGSRAARERLPGETTAQGPTRAAKPERYGSVAEWFKALVLKTSVRGTAPWVRIPPLPPTRPSSNLLWTPVGSVRTVNEFLTTSMSNDHHS